MKIVGVLLARMGSSRLWGKVMLPLAGQPMLWHCYQRLKACYPVECVYFLATDDPADAEIIALADSLGEPHVLRPNRGEDVAAGYLQLHAIANADVYLFISCDSPISEHIYCRRVIDAYVVDGAKYVIQDDPDITWLAVTAMMPVGRWEFEQHKSNSDPFYHLHPGGMMVAQPQRLWALPPQEIAVHVPLPEEREWKRPYRLQVDEPRDAYVMAELYRSLYHHPGQVIRAEDAIMWADAHPEVMRYNAPVVESAANLGGYTMYERARPELECVMHAVRAAKDARNILQYCRVCGAYLGYVREDDGRHWFWTARGVRLGRKGKVPCVCGVVREWYGERE